MPDDKLRDLRRVSATSGPAASPTITFPCDYPIKVVGDAAEDFTATVCQVVLRHDDSFDASSIEVVESRTARFLSVRLTLRATGEEQLKALFADLKATGRVHMVV
ncbi:YbeD family protein [Billgrantia sp. LNSP4103-1]|uniref:HP0495 family protein n=1 Tax=Billgrantia sp. LNSP4103-1 TaxID=3410266 RepID=UPI00403F9ED5